MSNLIKSSEEIEEMAVGGRLLAIFLEKLSKEAKIGVTTEKLNLFTEELFKEANVKSNFKNYGGFPAALCASVNEVVVHQPPSSYVLKEGDILTLDLGFIRHGFHADAAVTIPIGKISPLAQNLLLVTKESLRKGIQAAFPGNHLGDIGYEIQRHVEKQGLTIVRDLCGHGIGRDLHEFPNVLNRGSSGEGMILRAGMVFCIEPMVSLGSPEIVLGQDKLSYLTADRSLSAHFEHMIVIEENGPRILSKL